MSQITLADLGHGGGGGGGHGGGGGGWHGGGWGRRPVYGGGWYGGGGWYPWYDGYPYPIVSMDPVDPSFTSMPKDQVDAEDAKIKKIAAAVKQLLDQDKPKSSGMGQIYMDVMGPGSREGDIDREAGDNELVDEGMPAQAALLYRQRNNLVNMSDDTSGLMPPPVTSGLLGCPLMVGVSILAGAAVGYVVGAQVLGKKDKAKN